MKQILTLLVFALVGCGGKSDRNYTEFVDPLIGSGSHNHVFVGASVPFGAVQLSPSNLTQGGGWSSGYHISDSTLIGFAHAQLSGTGISEGGNVLFMPYTGALRGYNAAAYRSTYRPDNQISRAGYYSLTDDLYRVKTELTASERVGYHRYTYPDGAKARLLINLKQSVSWNRATHGTVQKVDNYTVEGFGPSTDLTADDRVYFAARFSEPIRGFEYMDTAMLASMSFDLRDSLLEAVVGISDVSIEEARQNLEAQAGKNFDKASKEARQKWNELLGTIDVQSTDSSLLRTFYTAFFHACDPSLASNQSNTYRATHPLHALIAPSRGADIVDSLYSNTTLNISGNEDCGQMSAWYILRTMGFSRVDPVGGVFVFGSPVFDLVTLRLPEGKSFTIRTVNNSPKNIYINSVTLDGKPHTTGNITYDQIMGGAELVFTMTDQIK